METKSTNAGLGRKITGPSKRYVLGLETKVRIAKEDFYKQNLTNKIFRVTEISTFKRSTFSLRAGNGENIEGQFCGPKLAEVDGRVSNLPGADWMKVHKNKTIAVFLSQFAQSIQLKGDWRVALAEFVFPKSIKTF